MADCGAGVSLGVRFFLKRDVLSDLHDLQGRGRGGPPAEALLGKLKRIGRSRGPLGKAAAMVHPGRHLLRRIHSIA